MSDLAGVVIISSINFLDFYPKILSIVSINISKDLKSAWNIKWFCYPSSLK